MSEENKVDLRLLFRNLQKQMLSKFATIDDGIRHPGTKGDATENNWTNMMRPYIPKRYRIDKAFVIDSKGQMSDQIDIVIYDSNFSPSLFDQNETKYVPAESVYGIIEVKQNLNKENICYAGDKISSVRKLHRTSGEIIDRGEARRARNLPYLLGGIVTHTSDWSPPLGTSFNQSLNSLNETSRIDFGCVLNAGSFRRDHLDYESSSIETSESEDSLMFFFLTLLYYLQRLGTVPAIDFKEYEKVLT